MEALRIISESWPIAFMFVAACGGGVLLYQLRSRNKQKRDELDYRVVTSKDVTTY